MPSLTDLDKGEPKMTTDFRGVYNSVLADGMNLPTDEPTAKVARPTLFKG